MSGAAFGLIILYAVIFAIGLAYFCGLENGKYRD